MDRDTSLPSLVVNLVTEAGGIDNCEGDASTLLVKLELYSPINIVYACNDNWMYVPTVMGLILTPSSTWALPASSDSL
jgi:hypothetical protein